MRRPHRRYSLFISVLTSALAIAAALVVVRGQAVAPRRAVLFPYSLPAVNRDLLAELPRGIHVRAAAPADGQVRASTLDRTGRTGARYVAGRVIVKFRDGAATASRVRALSAASTTGSVQERPSYANFDVVRIDPGEDAEAVAATLAAQPDVEYAQAAYRVSTRFVPNDQYYQRYQWNMRLIDMERAWDIQSAAGSAITVAVLDTGMAFQNAVVRFNASSFVDDAGVTHPALGTIDVPFAAGTDLASSSVNRFVAPHDFIWDDPNPVDLDGHGTHVTGTIGQLTNNTIGTAGVAFGVKLMPIKVIDSDWDDIFGSPNQGTDDIVARGIRYAADNGANVINMSIGRNGPPAPVIEDAIRYAVGKGVFLAIAGGNSFETDNALEVLAEIASRVDGAVSVAAVDPAKNHAYYSTTGSWVELSAPGGSDRGYGVDGMVLQQTLDVTQGLCLAEPTFCGVPPMIAPPRFDVLAFVFFDGTSMATPHVAGAAALLMQQGIKNPAAIEAALEHFATDLGAPGRDNTFGFGLIEVRNTLRGLGLAR